MPLNLYQSQYLLSTLSVWLILFPPDYFLLFCYFIPPQKKWHRVWEKYYINLNLQQLDTEQWSERVTRMRMQFSITSTEHWAVHICLSESTLCLRVKVQLTHFNDYSAHSRRPRSGCLLNIEFKWHNTRKDKTQKEEFIPSSANKQLASNRAS